MMIENRCGRCDRVFRGLRRFQRHLRLPCDQDTVLVRRQLAQAAREDGIPRRPRRGRKRAVP